MHPPPPEQEKIASVLSQWDRAISLTGHLITASHARRKALAREMLFGGRRFPGFVQSRVARGGTGEGFRCSANSPIDCPVDWGYPRIGEIAHPITRKNKAGTVDGGHLPVLSCTKHKGLVDSASYFGRRIFAENLSSYKVVRRGEFAYATNHIEEGSIGYQDRYDEALVSPMYTVFGISNRILGEFLYPVLKTDRYRYVFAANTNASVNRRGGLRWKEFARIRVPLPSREEQQSIVRALCAIDHEIEILQKQQSALSRQKKALMKKFFGGKGCGRDT